jgi:cytochrome c oxidase cbb3-type subunit 3
MRNAGKLALIIVTSALLASCGREEKEPAPPAPKADAAANEERLPAIAQVPFAPGGTEPVREQSEGMRAIMDDPEQIAAGRQLYLAMNCVGCHSHGGGGMGPALIDDTWIYGSEIENIAASIREGRPAGMPAFRGFLPEEQIWQIAAYVRSMPEAASR